MEFLLLPHYRVDPPAPIPKTPHVCQERYDGGPFLSYPARVGKAHFGTAYLDRMTFNLTERAYPAPTADLEAFIQNWLFFGLIAEFLGATSEDMPDHCSSPIKDPGSPSCYWSPV
jgi:hypothetical protein